jgi:hypothetical protein
VTLAVAGILDDERRSIAVRVCVEAISAGFASARIRTYLPIFIARRARAALTGWSAAADRAHTR